MGISFGPSWTVCLWKCPFATQADGLQATVAAGGYAFFLLQMSWKCFHIICTSQLAVCPMPTSSANAGTSVSFERSGWWMGMSDFHAGGESLVHVMTLSLVFNNFISHNHNQTPRSLRSLRSELIIQKTDVGGGVLILPVQMVHTNTFAQNSSPASFSCLKLLIGL